LNTRTTLLALLATLALGAAPAFGQFTINWSTIAGGGGTTTGSAFSLSGTVGQPDAGGPMIGGAFSLSGGFWLAAAPVCRPDINGDGQVNVADFLAFLSLYSAGSARADVNGDGQINVADFLAFLAAYSAGCV
jgi:hypothetical protein